MKNKIKNILKVIKKSGLKTSLKEILKTYKSQSIKKNTDNVDYNKIKNLFSLK